MGSRLLAGSLGWLLLACGGGEEDACAGGPVRLVETDNQWFRVEFAGDRTFVHLWGIFVHDLEDVTLVGAGCEAAREVASGVDMRPVRLHDDPADDDPAVVCERYDGHFYRIDVDGDGPPTLLLPWLDCRTLVRTPYGPVVGVHYDSEELRAAWLLPELPEERGAVKIGEDIASWEGMAWVGERLVYWGRGGLHVHDLATGADALRIAGADEVWTATASHVLWRANVGEAVAPVYVHDVAAAVDYYVGLYHGDEDYGYYGGPEPGWRFDASGEFILHLPNASGVAMTAHHLTGAQVAFPAWGERLAFPPGGGVVLQVGDAVRFAAPGRAEGVALQLPEGASVADVQAMVEHLEVRAGADLYAVPYDGGAARLLVRGVTAERVRVDEHVLLTLEDGVLAAVHQPSSGRVVLAVEVERFEYHPGHGLYYAHISESGAGRNGVWMLAEDLVLGAFARCGGACW